MRKISVDFGTGNTVVAVYNKNLEEVETVEIPGLTRTYRFVPPGKDEEELVHVVPSIISYRNDSILVGQEVVDQGLVEDPSTFRWMKMQVGERKQSTRRVADGSRVGAGEAGRAFLSRVLRSAFLEDDPETFRRDEFIFTAPVEAFEHFRDWLRMFGEDEGIANLRVLDEPTAAVLGYESTVRLDEHFLSFDFGCGTLDIQIVAVDLTASGERKAIQKGHAGERCGGMLIDLAIAADFALRHQLTFDEKRELDPQIVRLAEQVKIQLSRPAAVTESLSIAYERGGMQRILSTTYTRSCDCCERGKPEVAVAGQTAGGCLGCILLVNRFPQTVRAKLELALENAAMKSVRRDSIKRVVVTGGTSLMPFVREMLLEMFPADEGGNSRVDFTRVFDAVALGAGLGIVIPALAHDYGLTSLNSQTQKKEAINLFSRGEEYPTEVKEMIAVGAFDGMSKVSMFFVEQSQMGELNLAQSITDADGVLLPDRSRILKVVQRVLNPDNPTFFSVDPPFNLDRDQNRIRCSFQIDEHRRLLVTVHDNHGEGKFLLEKYPAIRLDRLGNQSTEA